MVFRNFPETSKDKAGKMSYVPMEILLEKTDSIYKLVILAAKRAVELNQGAGRLVEGMSPNTKVSSVALREIAEGKVFFRKEEEEKEKPKVKDKK